MRPSIESVDVDEVVSKIHCEVEEIDRQLETIKSYLKDPGVVEIAQGGVRGFSYCIHLYYSLENTFQPEDPEKFYGIPPGDLFRHLDDRSKSTNTPLINLCGDSLIRYIEPLNPNWHDGLEMSANELLKSTAKKIEGLQKMTRSLPLNMGDEGIVASLSVEAPKKQNSMGL